MSQPPGRGSDRNHRKDHNNNMAVTYTGGYSAPGSQTLPSFREVRVYLMLGFWSPIC
jgi:hypothetical protein